MFLCGLCGNTSAPTEKAARVVVETQIFTHPYRRDANHFVKEGKKTVSDDPGGVGTQIVKEVLACPRCAEARILN